MTRIVILIQGTDRKPWNGLRVAQLETWMSESGQVQIWHYEGRTRSAAPFDSVHEYLRWSPIFSRVLVGVDRVLQRLIRARGVPEAEADWQNRVIRVPATDVYLLGGKKFMSALQWAIEEYDPEWIYRTTVSSFVDLNGLLQFVNKCRSIGYYGGSPVGHPRGEFASGTNFLLSRDVADQILA